MLVGPTWPITVDSPRWTRTEVFDHNGSSSAVSVLAVRSVGEDAGDRVGH